MEESLKEFLEEKIPEQYTVGFWTIKSLANFLEESLKKLQFEEYYSANEEICSIFVASDIHIFNELILQFFKRLA